MLAHGRQLLLMILLWGAGLGAAGQFAKFSVVLPEVAALYPERGASIGFLVSMVSFVGVVLGLTAGVVLNRIGARRALILSLLLGAAVSLYQSLLPAFALMLSSRILEGLSHLGIVVAAPTLMSTMISIRLRPLAMSLWGTFFGVSFALTAWLGLPLVQMHGVESLFLLHAAHMALMACLLGAALPPSQTDTNHARQTDTVHPLRDYLQRHWQAYRSPFISAPSCGWLFYAATFVALMTVLPTLIPASQRALVAGVMPLAAICVSMTLGVFLLRAMQAVKVVLLGFTLATVLAIVFVVWPDTYWIPIALAGSLGLVQGASYAAIPQLNQQAGNQAIAYGTMAQTGNIGNIVGTPLLLAVLAATNLQSMMLMVAGLYLCAIATQRLLSAARQRQRSQ